MGAYDRVTFRGKTVDKITRAALIAAERKLGYQLTIVQGSYNAGSVSASAGTHDGGGAVDLAPWDWERKVLALREVGFAAWFRPELWINGKRIWGDHIHAILVDHKRLAPSAARQVEAYRAGRDGLAGNGPDTGPRLNPIPVFEWPPKKPTPLVSAVFEATTVPERRRALEVLAKRGRPQQAELARRWLNASREISSCRGALRKIEVKK